MKKNRHEAILRIIEKNNVSTQTDLLNLLNAEGFETTQATISRDIKDLRLVKKPDAMGRSVYTVDTINKAELSDKYKSVFKHSVISVDFALNTVVIRCYTGMANAACAALDAMEWNDMVGSLAGDDTIFVVCRTVEAAENMKELIENLVG